MDGSLLPSGLATLAGLGLLTWVLIKNSQPRLPYPPGPTPLPFIGNILNIPHEKEWLVYQEWAKAYGLFSPQLTIMYVQRLTYFLGDVMHVEALGQHIIVLNSAKGANELFERRSTIYSSRPNAVMMSQL